MMLKHVFQCFISSLILLPACVSGQEIGALFIGFGLSNADGTKIIATDKIEDPAQVNSAIAPGGQTVTVKYIGDQKAGKNYRFRQSIYTVDQIPGALYEVVSDTVTQGVCVLAGPGFSDQIELLEATASNYTPLDDIWAERIETSKNKTVERTWVATRFDETSMVAIVLFEPDARGTLASLVLIHNDTLVFKDFPKSDAGWRVDDEGVFGGTDISVLFAYKNGDRIGVAYAWSAAEGNSLRIIESYGSVFREIKEGYHYHAPM